MIKKHILEFVFTILFLILSVILNLQFLDGSNINHTIAGHDEYIAVKEVYSILHPVSFKHFVMAIISGDVLFYGRIMFYLDAFFAFIPFKVWGINGMVFTIRMVHAGFLLAALLLLSKTFLKSNLQKALFFAGTFCLYYTMYFIMMPKPEPHQLLTLAWFLNRFRKSGWAFGPHYFWMGIAYGLKFNILLLLPVVFGLPIIRKKGLTWKSEIKSGLKSFFIFLAGIVVAVPCLALSPLKPVFLNAYLHETFGSTAKSYDDATLTAREWLQSGLGGSYLGHWVWAFPFVMLVLVMLYLSAKKAFKTRDFSISVLLVSGFVLNAVIVITAKRLWPHYLWTGYILLLLGLISAIGSDSTYFIKKGLTFIIAAFIGSSVFFYLKRELPLFLNFSKVHETREAAARSLQARAYLRNKFPVGSIGTDATVLYPFSDFTQARVYHPFAGTAPQSRETRFYWYGDAPQNIWENNEAVVFYKRHPERLIKEHSAIYKGMQNELLELYRQHIRDNFIRDTAFGEIIVYIRR